MSHDPPTRMLRFIEAEGSTAEVNTLMSARGSLDDVIIAIMDANDAAR